MDFLSFHSSISRGSALSELVAFINRQPLAVRERDGDGRLPLHLAAEYNRKDVFLFLLEKYPLGAALADNLGLLPAHYLAKSCGDVSLLEAVLQTSPDSIKQKDQDGWLPLHHAAKSNSSVEVVSLLVRRYAGGLCQRTANGSLPLHCAAHQNRESTVLHFLIDQYPEGLWEVGKQGMLALHYAARSNGSSEVLLSLLTAYPAAAETPDEGGRLPIHHCVRNPAALTLLPHLIHASDEAVQATDSNGWLPLHYAARFTSSIALIDYLLQAYPEAATIGDVEGWLPLHHAAMQGLEVGPVLRLVDHCLHSVIYPAHSAEKMAYELASPGSVKADALRLLHRALTDDYPPRLQAAHPLHVIGDNCAGKTVLAHWLTERGTDPGWLMDRMHSVDMQHGRTSSGVHVTRAEEVLEETLLAFDLPQARPCQHSMLYLVHDYSTSLLHLPQHVDLLLRPGSVYLVVLPLYDVEGRSRYSLAAVKARMHAWLAHLREIAALEGRNHVLPVLLVVNPFLGLSGSYTLEEATDAAQFLLRELRRSYNVAIYPSPDEEGGSEQETEDYSSYDLLLLGGGPVVADLRSRTSTQGVLDSLRAAVSAVFTYTLFSHSTQGQKLMEEQDESLMVPMRTLSPLYTFASKLLNSLRLSACMKFGDYMPLLRSAVNAFCSNQFPPPPPVNAATPSGGVGMSGSSTHSGSSVHSTGSGRGREAIEVVQEVLTRYLFSLFQDGGELVALARCTSSMHYLTSLSAFLPPATIDNPTSPLGLLDVEVEREEEVRLVGTSLHLLGRSIYGEVSQALSTLAHSLGATRCSIAAIQALPPIHLLALSRQEVVSVLLQTGLILHCDGEDVFFNLPPADMFLTSKFLKTMSFAEDVGAVVRGAVAFSTSQEVTASHSICRLYSSTSLSDTTSSAPPQEAGLGSWWLRQHFVLHLLHLLAPRTPEVVVPLRATSEEAQDGGVHLVHRLPNGERLDILFLAMGKDSLWLYLSVSSFSSSFLEQESCRALALGTLARVQHLLADTLSLYLPQLVEYSCSSGLIPHFLQAAAGEGGGAVINEDLVSLAELEERYLLGTAKEAQEIAVGLLGLSHLPLPSIPPPPPPPTFQPPVELEGKCEEVVQQEQKTEEVVEVVEVVEEPQKDPFFAISPVHGPVNSLAASEEAFSPDLLARALLASRLLPRTTSGSLDKEEERQIRQVLGRAVLACLRGQRRPAVGSGQLVLVSRAKMRFLVDDVLARYYCYCEGQLATNNNIPLYPLLRQSGSLPMYLPVLQEVVGEECSQLGHYRLHLLCGVCLTPGRAYDFHTLPSSSSSSSSCLQDDILEMVAPTLLILEAMLKLKKPPARALTVGSLLQPALDLLLLRALETSTTASASSAALGESTTAITRDVTRLQRLQRSLFDLMRSFLLPIANDHDGAGNGGRKRSRRRVLGVGRAIVVADLFGYCPPALRIPDSYQIARLHAILRDDYRLGSGLTQGRSRGGLSAWLCGPSTTTFSSTTIDTVSSSEEEKKLLSHSCSGCYERFLKRGEDCLSYRVLS